MELSLRGQSGMSTIPLGTKEGLHMLFKRGKQTALTRVEVHEATQRALNDWSEDAGRNGITAEQIAMLAAKLERLRAPIQR
jgi:hypothetical protein